MIVKLSTTPWNIKSNKKITKNISLYKKNSKIILEKSYYLNINLIERKLENL